jgi:hypothetical protein
LNADKVSARLPQCSIPAARRECQGWTINDDLGAAPGATSSRLAHGVAAQIRGWRADGRRLDRCRLQAADARDGCVGAR